MCFTFLINEVRLVQDSKKKYDEFFMIPEVPDDINSHGYLLDEDGSVLDKKCGKAHNIFHMHDKEDSNQGEEAHFNHENDDRSISEFFEEARRNVRAVSVGGKNEMFGGRF